VHLDVATSGVAPDLASLLHALSRVVELARASPVQMLLDRTGASPDAERRSRVAEWLKGDALEVRDRITAFAIVAPSPLLRGTITAIRWFFPERMLRSETFDTRERALAWINTRR
jgi:hypothetical protein